MFYIYNLHDCNIKLITHCIYMIMLYEITLHTCSKQYKLEKMTGDVKYTGFVC